MPGSGCAGSVHAWVGLRGMPGPRDEAARKGRAAMPGECEREGGGAAEPRKKKGAGEEEGEGLTAGGRTAGGDGRARAVAGELREVGERGDRAWGLREGERGAVLGGAWRVGRTRQGGGGGLTARAGRGVRAGGGWAARGARGRPRLGRRAGPRRGGGELGHEAAAGPRAGGKGEREGEAGPRKEASLGREGGFSIFPFSFKLQILS
jgi:hypothetical protein